MAHETLIQCFSDQIHRFPSKTSIFDVVYTPNNASYKSILESTIANLRFLSPSTAKPLAIITPLENSHVQATVACCKLTGVQIRTRSGGHDFEGMSSTSQAPFVILDLRKMRSVRVDVESESAWVESGATIGELCYAIAERSAVHGFAAGSFPGLGVGGHFSGGGIGYLVRKYGLSVDNVIDSVVVDAEARIMDKESMGRDLFWAIRGGGGGCFGVVLAWKIRLVRVPPVATVFKVSRTFEQGAIDVLHQWQFSGPKLDEDVTILAELNRFGATFTSLYLGRAEKLLEMMQEIFPQLQLTKQDCKEMKWIESVLFLSEYPGEHTIQVLNNGSASASFRVHLKLKSDLIYDPLPYDTIKEIYAHSCELHSLVVYFQPYGGIMERVAESETAFPHRKVAYEMLYLVAWMGGDGDGVKHMKGVRELYEFMTPFVPSNPRGAYVNSRDLDFGTNDGTTTYDKAKEAWGLRYFKNNFEKLAIVKGKVDPTNFFSHEQSIPPLFVPHQEVQCSQNFKETLLDEM